MVYYGVSLGLDSFSGDVFINNMLLGIVEIPAYLGMVPLLALGRRPSLTGTLVLAGVSLILVGVIPWGDGWYFAVLLHQRIACSWWMEVDMCTGG